MFKDLGTLGQLAMLDLIDVAETAPAIKHLDLAQVVHLANDKLQIRLLLSPPKNIPLEQLKD